MKYALANMLNGAGGLNADQLALDLPFAVTKSLTAAKGPTPTFTRASSGTFVGSNGLIQSAGNNVARFDHDPVTLASKGLLIEESRTNLTIRSDDFGASEWNASAQRNLTVTVNNTTSPSGAADADLLTVGATTTAYQVIQNLPATGNITSGTTYTVSCYFKPNQVTRVSIWAGNFVTLPIDAIFDLTGAGSVVANAFGTASIQQAGNGWYRCIVTGTAGATSNTTLRLSPVAGTSRTYPGNSVDSFYAWGAQLEAGSFATSYIPTTTASVVRSADVCSISGAAFSGFYNATEGTSFVSAIKNTNTGNPRLLVITNGTSGNRVDMTRATSAEQIDYYAGGSFLHTLNLGSIATGVNYKIAHAMAANNFAASRDGLTPVTNNSGVMVTADRIIIGATFNGAANFFNGTISAIRYYRKRLPNAKLQALTV